MAADPIPFVDLGWSYRELQAELDEATRRFFASGWYVLGKEVEAFEQEYAAYCGAKHCVGVANGLDAMNLVLRAWDICPGDEVIVPSNTYIATWLAVSYAGATPVPVEPDPATCNLDPARIEAAIPPGWSVVCGGAGRWKMPIPFSDSFPWNRLAMPQSDSVIFPTINIHEDYIQM